MKFMNCRVLAALAMFATAWSVQAQTYPGKPVRMIVGFTAGSEIDVVGRLIAQEMSETVSCAASRNISPVMCVPLPTPAWP